jgi:hypothetical protein
MKRTRLPLLVLLAIAVIGVAGPLRGADAGKGRAKQIKYVGPHPIGKAHGGGVCHIEVPHVHVYMPSDVKVQYRVVDGGYYFIGDPVAYGWDGPKYVYEGHHPVAVGELVYDHRGEDDVEYCYIDGPHYHYYQPAAELSFEMKGDAYWYTGEFPEAYVDARAELDPIDVVYEPIGYVRPEVVVAPPVGGVGIGGPVVVVDGPHGHAHAAVGVGVEVVAPRLEVEVAVPTLVIGGGVIVGGGHHHDNGRHNGWYKGGKGRKHSGGRRGGRGHWKW